MPNLSTKIFDYRAKHKLSQKEFGRLIGLDKTVISRIEGNRYLSKKSKVIRRVQMFFEELPNA